MEDSYWPYRKNGCQVIDFSMTVARIMRQVRGFGLVECFAHAPTLLLSVRRVIGWVETHNRQPGRIAFVCNRTIVMTAADGYIGLAEWSFVSPGIAAEIPRSMKDKTISVDFNVSARQKGELWQAITSRKNTFLPAQDRSPSGV